MASPCEELKTSPTIRLETYYLRTRDCPCFAPLTHEKSELMFNELSKCSQYNLVFHLPHKQVNICLSKVASNHQVDSSAEFEYCIKCIDRNLIFQSNLTATSLYFLCKAQHQQLIISAFSGNLTLEGRHLLSQRDLVICHKPS